MQVPSKQNVNRHGRNHRRQQSRQHDGQTAHRAFDGAHFHGLGRAGRMRRVADGQSPGDCIAQPQTPTDNITDRCAQNARDNHRLHRQGDHPAQLFRDADGNRGRHRYRHQ